MGRDGTLLLGAVSAYGSSNHVVQVYPEQVEFASRDDMPESGFGKLWAAVNSVVIYSGL